VFYGLFVLAAAVHGAIGLRTVAAEWLGWRGRGADTAAALIALALLATGWRAVLAVSL
jgi:fumarate reductase subunit C